MSDDVFSLETQEMLVKTESTRVRTAAKVRDVDLQYVASELRSGSDHPEKRWIGLLLTASLGVCITAFFSGVATLGIKSAPLWLTCDYFIIMFLTGVLSIVLHKYNTDIKDEARSANLRVISFMENLEWIERVEPEAN